MKKKSIRFAYLGLFCLIWLVNFNITVAQTVDNTGLFPAIKAGSTDTILFASTIFYDVNSNGIFDASFNLSAGEISTWNDYSTSLAFYATGFEVWDGSSFSNTNVVTFEPGDPVYIWIDVNVATKAYDTWVKTGSMTDPVLVHANAGFRRTGVDSICRWSALHNPGKEPDTISVETVEFVNDIGVYPASYTDATLSGISLDAGSLIPAFDPGTTSYTVTLPEGTASVIVSATPKNTEAAVSGTGYINVSSGTGTAALVVTAKDNATTETYTIDFTVEGNYAMSLPGGADGSLSNVDISGLTLNSLPATIEFWIKPNGDQVAYAGLFYHRGTGDAGVQYAAGWQGLNKLRMNYQGASIVTDPIVPNEWHHVVMVVTDTSNTLYVDGISYHAGASQTAYDFSTGNFYLGWDMDVADRTFKGLIDEVRVWNIAKDSTALATSKYDTLAGDEPGLIAYWDFDDQAATATDVTGNGWDGTISGGNYVSSFVRTDSDGDGFYNFVDNCPETANADQADMDGDGTGDVCDNDMDGDGIANADDNCPETSNADQEDIDEDGIGDVCDPELPEGLNFAMSLPGGPVGANSNVAIPPLNITSLPVTVEMWYKPDKTQNNYATLWYTRGTSTNCGVQYDRWTDQGKIKAVWTGASEIPEEKPIPEEWNHVALVVTSTSKTLYINGVPFKESGTSFSNFPFDGTTYLGYDEAEPSRTLKGIIDEVRIWNVARDSAEIADNKYKVLTGNEPNLVAYWNFDDRTVTATDGTGNGLDGTITGGTYVLSYLNTMIYINSDAGQEDAIVNTSTSDNVVMALKIKTKFSNDPFTLSGLYLSAKGTTSLSDIAGVKVYASGLDSVFTTDSLIAQVEGPLTSEAFQLKCDYALSGGKNFFWITYDVDKDATKGNILDIVCDSFQIAGQDTSYHKPETSAPDGSLTVNPDIFIHFAKLGTSIVTDKAYTTANGANFVSFQQNAIMSYNGYQYVTYWNYAKHVCLARRKMPLGEWKEVEFTDYTSSYDLGDNHYNISFGICKKDGTIHLAYDHHNDDLNYRVSVADLANKPDSIVWNASSFKANRDYLVEGTSINKSLFYEAVTYPRFILKPDGNMLFECRTGMSGDGNSNLWEYSGETGTWEYIGEYMHGREDGMPAGYTSKCGYINGLHYTPGGTRLHVSLVWREDFGGQTNHEVYYAYSDDDGRTWYNNEGTLIGTSGSNPMNYNSPGFKVYSVAQNRGLINQESQAVDSKGGIHILQSYILDSEPDNSNWGDSRAKAWLRHIYIDGSGTWQSDVIAPSNTDRSEIAVDENDNLYVVAPGYRVYFAGAADKWKTWTEFDISQNGIATAEGLIDREALLNENVLSFVFASKDYSTTKGKIIVPCYILEKSKPGTGNGLNIMVFEDTGFQTYVSQKLDVVDITSDDISVGGQEFGLQVKGKVETQFAEVYTLYLTTSGNTKVWVNDSLVVETGNLSSATEFQIDLDLIPLHKYDVVIEGVFSSATVKCKLEWSSHSQERGLVPLTALYGELEHISGLSKKRLENEFSCYPNPSKDFFNLYVRGFFSYEIYNMQGTMLESGSGKGQLKVGANLLEGMYVIRISQNEVYMVKRIIKQ